MERKGLSNSLKGHSLGMKDNYNNNKVKDLWDCTSESHDGRGDLVAARFLWPPRSYTCSFCKREFRSAQALGGHMNVHRRDRARLRQMSPPRDGQYPFLHLSLNPNPNPNLSSSTSWFPPLITTSTLVSSSSPLIETKKCGMDSASGDHRVPDLTKMKASKALFGVGEGEYKVKLDLEFGLLSDSKQDLDLELRLGYSN